MTTDFASFKQQVQRYLLGQSATIEDVVREWIDPIRNDSTSRLPYFVLPINATDMANINSMLGISYDTLTGVLKPFERTEDVDFANTYLISLIKEFYVLTNLGYLSASDKQSVRYIELGQEIERLKGERDKQRGPITQLGVTNWVNEAVYPTNYTAPSAGDNTYYQYIKLYLKSIRSTWQEESLTGAITNYSRDTRTIAYLDKPAEGITLSLLVYNTILTPWLDVYKALLKAAVNTVTRDSSKKIYLYVPQAGGLNNLIARKFDCDLVSVRTGNKFEDLVQLDISMVVNSTLKTQISFTA